jgi:hypothetical protein
MIETIMTVFAIATFIIFSAVMIIAAFLYYWMDK